MRIRFSLAIVALAVVALTSACAGPQVLTQSGNWPWTRPAATPEQLTTQSVGGQPLAPAGWTNQSRIVLNAQFPDPSADLTTEVEFRPAYQVFIGQPTVAGKRGTRGVTVDFPLSDTSYHWQMRTRSSGNQLSPWVVFDGTVGYQPDPPAAPKLAELPRNGNSASRTLSFDWTATADSAGIDKFLFGIDQTAAADLKSAASTDKLSASVTVPADGQWYFHVAALDGAGNWSPTATVAVHVDTVVPAVSDLKPSAQSFNPAVDTITFAGRLNKSSLTSELILPAQPGPAIRTFPAATQNGDFSLPWDGKDDHGQLVPAGDYRLQVTAKDVAGNEGAAISAPIKVTDKRIVVSLSQQKLWAYSGSQVFLQSLVTTGGPELPTPVGTFYILQKFSPFTFKSPWPKGSPYWYADSPTNYAMLFDDGGYFIHDAPWRSFFGPGSNTVDGKPGDNNTGTHGCVNVPAGVQATLFAWTTPGTPVVIQA